MSTMVSTSLNHVKAKCRNRAARMSTDELIRLRDELTGQPDKKFSYRKQCMLEAVSAELSRRIRRT